MRISSHTADTVISYVSSHRNAIGTGFFALSLLGNLTLRSFHSPVLSLTWTALAIGILFTGASIGNKKVLWSLIALLTFHALAIPGSIIWGTGNWELTAGVVMWMTPALLLYLANDTGLVFRWMIPVYLVHAFLIIVEGLTKWTFVGEVIIRQGQNTGLANNPNLAAGFLLLGIIYLMTNSKTNWLALPLLVALVFTGSRWGLVVAAGLLPIMAVTGSISWRPLAGAGAAIVLGVVLLGLFAGEGYRIAGYGSITAAAQAAQTDIGVRLAVPHIPSILPSGVAEHPGLHNVPLRIAVENGLIAAGLWILITGWALATNQVTKNQPEPTPEKKPEHRPFNHTHRWILLSLVLLSVLDYYTWMGHLGGFWWLLIGLQLKGIRTPVTLQPACDIVRIPDQSSPSASPNGAKQSVSLLSSSPGQEPSAQGLQSPSSLSEEPNRRSLGK